MISGMRECFCRDSIPVRSDSDRQKERYDGFGGLELQKQRERWKVLLTKEMESYLESSLEELKQLIRDLCAIPAPSNHEGERAAFCKKWFEEAGSKGTYIDEALNVICPVGVTGDNDVTVFMAHTDTVFPDTEPMPFKETETKMYCPGVVDDTGNLAVMMICARYFLQHEVPRRTGMVFVANSCEEGLGNLKGCRAVCDALGSRIRRFVSFDGYDLRAMVTSAVGSHRYRVTVRTAGGHSFGSFGNRNAIETLASMIETLYAVKVPQIAGTKTTYNVGTIVGGTSVNTIAQRAEMLYEYRSDDRMCLEKMQGIFEKVVEAYRAMDIDVNVEMVGDRPCRGEVDSAKQESLVETCREALRMITGAEALCGSGSTDANIPLSLGIPSVVLSACGGRGCHTREEELDLDTLLPGSKLTMEAILSVSEME